MTPTPSIPFEFCHLISQLAFEYSTLFCFFYFAQTENQLKIFQMFQIGEGKIGIPDKKDLHIGFLIWKKEANLMKHLKTGSKLKNPILPLWVISSDDHWGVLFSPNADLLKQFTKE